MEDLIRRQDVINLMKEWSGGFDYIETSTESAIKEIQQLSSVHPEWLTDKEQRIFLAAMSREERVCKTVDKESAYCIVQYEDSLISICHEIKRKVLSALVN